MAKLTFHGHATCSIEADDGSKLVIDPYFSDNPATKLAVEDVEADFILVTHGHADHVADLIPLAEKTNATVISTFEIAAYMESKGFPASPQHIGGGVQFPFGYVKLTNSPHGGIVQLPGGEAFTSVSAGVLINFASGQRFYHAGDTGLTMDMQLLKGKVDVAMLPIGDRFTMGPEDAVRAVEFIEPEVVIPMHYDTWPLIVQDVGAFKAAVGDRARVEIMMPGDVWEF
ncbi:MAG: metal-dependent hydrolase [Gemmatimonadota bacterium]|nr:metal-dependent hydrolase [Gemmatimonadota bacterium]|tara:strand:+ start:1847 stop:2530 length:684 start_codon:yes stop_codon:yes gene_type:complete